MEKKGGIFRLCLKLNIFWVLDLLNMKTGALGNCFPTF